MKSWMMRTQKPRSGMPDEGASRLNTVTRKSSNDVRILRANTGVRMETHALRRKRCLAMVVAKKRDTPDVLRQSDISIERTKEQLDSMSASSMLTPVLSGFVLTRTNHVSKRILFHTVPARLNCSPQP